MHEREFYDRVSKCLDLLAPRRRTAMLALHREVQEEYLAGLAAITPARAAERGSDGRSIAQVVGHIAEWDRFLLQSAGELAAGVRWPRLMGLNGYLDEEGQPHDFDSLDAFNAFQAERQESLPWAAIQATAQQMARRLYQIFRTPALLSTETLQRSAPLTWNLPDGRCCTEPVGWHLWIVVMEHEGVEHAGDLGLPRV